MELTSLIFVCICMPAGYLVQRFAPEKAKNAVLLLMSAALIAWGNPRDLLLVLLSCVFNYFTALELAALKVAGKTRYARGVFWSGVGLNLALLLFYKYTGFALGIFGVHPVLPAAPMGISFYTFSTISFLTDVYRGDEKAPRSFLSLALYLTYFPKFISGPIVPYRDFAPQTGARTLTQADADAGFTRFAVGLAKKLVLADTLSATFSAITALPVRSLTVTHAWLGMLLYAFTLYFDFSGYSDMAIGLGRVCGFKFDENFNYPYLSESVTEFWRRWHISLGMWFRNYVYIPLGGSRKGTKRTVINLIVVWLLTGLWHGAAWTFIVWGVYHVLLLMAEKFVFSGVKKALPKPVNVALTFLLAVLGWVPFFSVSLPYAGAFFCRLFGIGGAGFVNENALYLLRGSWAWLLLAAVGATPLIKLAGKRLRSASFYRPLKVAAVLALLLLSIAAMVSGTFRTFLYAQF